VAIVFGLLAAISYGGSDFAAGLASRRVAPAVITVAVESLTLLTVLIELLVAAPRLPTMHVLAWGAVSGLGTALGTLSLYKGLAVARMSVVATLAAVLNAVIPVIVGLALGNHLGPLAAIGIVIALPAIGLVSWHPDQLNDQATREGVIYGVLAGIGFSLLFIALDQAGTRSGGWPVVPSQIVALVIVLPLAVRGLRTTSAPTRGTMWITLGSGVSSRRSPWLCRCTRRRPCYWPVPSWPSIGTERKLSAYCSRWPRSCWSVSAEPSRCQLNRGGVS
jgi:uncharacterized membrane protein